jgi:hypothetical protein
MDNKQSWSSRSFEGKLPLVKDYQLVTESMVDTEKWDKDPRRVADGPIYICVECAQLQDKAPQQNKCRCYPELYGGRRTIPPVQIFDTTMGKGNGLMARFVSPLPQMDNCKDSP